MNYKCIVWCNFNNNSGTSGSSNGAKWKMTDTGVIDVEFDGFETNDTHYIAIVRGEVSGNGNECTIITDKTTKGFRILNKKDINTMASYDYGTIAVFYDPTKVTKIPQPDFYTQLLTTGDTITLTNWDDASKPRYIGVPTNSIGSGAPNFLIRDIVYSAASKVLVDSTTMDRFETLEFEDKTFFKVYHKDHTAPLGRWIIDDRQGGIDIWLLMDSNTDQPYEE